MPSIGCPRNCPAGCGGACPLRGRSLTGRRSCCTTPQLRDSIPSRPRRSLRSSSACGTSTASRRRSEEHTSELQSRLHLVCRLLLEKKKKRLLACQEMTPEAYPQSATEPRTVAIVNC